MHGKQVVGQAFIGIGAFKHLDTKNRHRAVRRHAAIRLAILVRLYAGQAVETVASASSVLFGLAGSRCRIVPQHARDGERSAKEYFAAVID